MVDGIPIKPVTPAAGQANQEEVRKAAATVPGGSRYFPRSPRLQASPWQRIDRELKKLRDTVGAHAALTCVAGESKTIGGFGRNDRFSYIQRFGAPGEVGNSALMEAGTAIRHHWLGTLVKVFVCLYLELYMAIDSVRYIAYYF
jgi:hypothetical protein